MAGSGRRSLWVPILLAAGAFVGTFALRFKTDRLAGGETGQIDPAPPDVVIPQASGDTVAELTFVFLSSGTCPACNDPELPRLIRGAVTHLAARARSTGLSFAAIGVGLDGTTELGIRDLQRFGPFDEMLIGRGWQGTGAMIFLWDAYVGPPLVPQVLILSRQLVISPNGIDEIGRGKMLGRHAGLPEIKRWLAAGFPIEHVAARAGT